jgi:peptidoglycan/xylan/chitin deacetylase (PgdA/CDA1 family)
VNAKTLCAALVYGSRLTHLARWVNRRRILILTYHGVLPGSPDPRDYFARNCVGRETFRWQMRYLRRHYRCLSLGEAVEAIGSGRSLPLRSAVVTFDDGFRNNYLYAFPTLCDLGIPATIFLTTGHIGQGLRQLWTERAAWLMVAARRKSLMLSLPGRRLEFHLPTRAARYQAARRLLQLMKAMPEYERQLVLEQLEREADVSPKETLDAARYEFLEWSDIREMAQEGIEFGSHTVSHTLLATLDAERRWREVQESKVAVERHVSRPCELFAYPNGTRADFQEIDKTNLRQAGYRCAVSQIAGLNAAGADLFELRRLNIGLGHDRLLFKAQVSGLWPWLRRVARRDAACDDAVAA